MFILLDIDGVMVPTFSWKSATFSDDDFMIFSTKAVVALNKILEQTNATIILTTSHKGNFTIDQWRNIFIKRNILITAIGKLPDNITHRSRLEEVLNWLNTNQVNDCYVIIDDDKSLNDLPLSAKQRLVLTHTTIGLTEELAEEAILKFYK